VPNFVADGIDSAIHVGDVSDPTAVATRLSEVPRIVVAAPSVLGSGALPEHPSKLVELSWLAFRTYYKPVSR
jgi:hypothetical protein